MQKQITVTTPQSEYDIVIGRGILQAFDQYGASLQRGNLFVISNATVWSLLSGRFDGMIEQDRVALMQDGEAYKNLDTVRQLYSDSIAAGVDRGTTILAVGGGVVGDTAGFVAATYMRGIPLVQIPTTLLSMVDSSVGSKVGVDMAQGKNIVGAFKSPEVVLIDPDVLDTLPDIEVRCGYAEVVKHGLIADKGLLDASLYRRDGFDDLIERAVRVKVNIVQQDPFEAGVRAYLNLGHTFAHAIERVTHYSVRHGMAVAIGLMAAARLSHRLSLADSSVVDTTHELLQQLDLPVSIGQLDPELIYGAMKTDKKWVQGRSRFVLLEGIGRPTIVQDVPAEDVIAVLNGMHGTTAVTSIATKTDD